MVGDRELAGRLHCNPNGRCEQSDDKTWDPVTRQVVQKFSDSNGSHSERHGTYDSATTNVTLREKWKQPGAVSGRRYSERVIVPAMVPPCS
jgi:hypothetical protein